MHKKKWYSDSPVFMPMASISPEYTCIYNKRIDTAGSKRITRKLFRMPFSNKHQGEISRKAERRIKKAISWLLEITDEKTYFSERHGKSFKFKINFITLTLPSKQVHTDGEIKKDCLNQFLIECRKNYKVINYIWRAEAQKNGNIHFHICMDQYIHHSTIRKMWNRIIEKKGYVTAYADEMREFHKDGFKVRKDLIKFWPKHKQIRAYNAGFRNNWSSPNSTDVHAIKNINNISAYLAKYCTKNSDTRAIEGKLWGLSTGLSSCKSLSIELIGKEADEMSIIQPVFEHRVKRLEKCTIIYEKASLITTWFKGVISRAWNLHKEELKQMFSEKRQSALKLAT